MSGSQLFAVVGAFAVLGYAPVLHAQVCSNDSDCASGEFCKFEERCAPGSGAQCEPTIDNTIGECELEPAGPPPSPPYPPQLGSVCERTYPQLPPTHQAFGTCDGETYFAPVYDELFRASETGVSEPMEANAYVFIGADGVFDRPVIVPDGLDLSSTRVWQCLYGLMNQSGTIDAGLAQGFDFVLVDFRTGAGNIVRNASLLTDLILQIDARTNHAPAVFVGPSMGGQVGRWSLLDLQARGIRHPVVSFISYDSPHLGAVIPTGFQFVVDAFRELGAADDREGLSRPAPRQLLLQHLDTGPVTRAINASLTEGFEDVKTVSLSPDTAFTSFYNQIEAMGGFPSLPRLVAFANGSDRGRPQVSTTGFALRPGSPFLRADEDNDVLTKIRVDVSADGQNAEVMLIDRKITVSKRQRVKRRLENGFGLGTAPGGTRSTVFDVAEQLRRDGVEDIDIRAAVHGFIPTKSAFAYSGDWFDDIRFEIDSGRETTPFDTVYAPDVNEDHVCITPAERDQLLEELDFPRRYRAAWLAAVL